MSPTQGMSWRERLAESCRRVGVDRTCFILGGIALLLFAIGSLWGVPHATSVITDRGWDVDGVAGMSVLAEFHNLLIHPKPDWYTAYPLFHYLVLGALYIPYLGYLRLSGGFPAPSESFPYGFEDPITTLAILTIIARAVNVLMAVGVVIAAYLIAKTLWDKAAATWAALVVLLAGTMVFYARTSNLDVPALFWTALGALVAIRILTLGLTRRRAILLGVAAALAVATKDQAYGALVPGLAFLALAVSWPRGRAEGQPGVKRAWGHLLVMTLVGVAVYAVANGIVFRPSRFVRHVEFVTGFERSFFNLQHASTLTILRPATVSGYATLLWDTLRATATSIGPLLLIAGLVGISLAWRRRPASRLLVWMGVGFVVLSLFPIRHMQYRYALFPGFVLALFAGYAISWAWGRGGPRRVAAGVVIAIGMGWQVLTASDLTYQMLFDARYRAGDWLATTAEPGDRFGYFGARHQLPSIPEGVVPIELMGDSSAVERLARGAGGMRFLVVAPDYFSDPSRERSLFLPETMYRRLKDGTLGYQRVAVFETPSLLRRPLPYLPYVNPTVQFFEWTGASISGEGE